MEVSVTMWAHAHGMLALYHHGNFQVDEEAFREAFQASGARMMAGLATEALTEELVAGYDNDEVPEVGARS